jgi:uncharacterized membrane protein YdcZ (DUF606 family)
LQAAAIPFLLLVGSMLALQAAANVQLAGAMSSPIGASALQLGIGAGLLLALAGVAGSLGAFDLLGEAEPWALAGGLGSAVYISAGILASTPATAAPGSRRSPRTPGTTTA